MMTSNNLSVFDFQSYSVRVLDINGNPWFVAKDVCRVLDIVDHKTATRKLDDDEKGVHTSDTPGGNQDMKVVSESGLYSLIFSSRKPEAKIFRKWVTKDVLPNIRKTGEYKLNQQKLESIYSDRATIKEIDSAYDFYKKAFGDSYAYQYAHQMMKKHQPHLAGNEPPKESRPSLPILLTPTEIAEQLDINYQTGNPNPRKVNSVLEQLGYQIRVNGSWQPTNKAIQFDHYDIKPIDTNSKSQKSQLLWTQLMVSILKEFAIV